LEQNELVEVHISVTIDRGPPKTLAGMKKSIYHPHLVTLLCALSMALLSACASRPAPHSEIFKPVEKQAASVLMSKEDLALIEESNNPVYRIGSGDVLRLEVFGRPEVSGKHIVGPDGKITVPLAGDISLGERTREEGRNLVTERMRTFFTQPFVTLIVDEYTSNQVTVLGRVEHAGVQKFAQAPTLAEVLAGAGAMPILDKQATLTRCAIMRGRDKLIWVDLKALLNGDPAYNLRMKKGDIVFIPDSSDTSIYVLGQVTRPGSYRLTPRMTVLDALAQAGGPTEDAKPEQIGLYRAGSNSTEMISFADLINPARAVNFVMEDGDVLFLPRNGISEFGYLMRQISPGLSFLTFGTTLSTLSK
jgi:polysaccharide export outer membrane protein